jgi:hypothetical protein
MMTTLATTPSCPVCHHRRHTANEWCAGRCTQPVCDARRMPEPGEQCLLGGSIFLDKNRRGIGKSQSIWTDSKMEAAGAPARDACTRSPDPIRGASHQPSLRWRWGCHHRHRPPPTPPHT